MLNSQLLRGVTFAGVALAASFAAGNKAAVAGHGGFRQAAVGGVSIDPEGVLREADPAARKLLLADFQKNLAKPSPEMLTPVGMRMISLKGIEAACADALANNLGKIPDEVKYLGGLQRIQYVFVYPDQNDIVLAGPGEGWRVDERANVVGVTSGRPVLQLDDLLVALRQARAARDEGITCSIDPTEEGYRRLNELLASQKGAGRANPAALEEAMKAAFGPQQITVTGVPATSHFARVMVAADYKMKRIAMNLDASPVKGLSGYLDMVKSGGASPNPRWWLACNYEPLARSEDGLAWELRGQGVKALTEDEQVNSDGEVRGTGKTSAAAANWAKTFTDKYDELSVKEPIFGELRNIMDMCVVAAIIEKEDLVGAAGASFPLLMGPSSEMAPEVWSAPKTVAPQVSFVRTRNGYVVSASGGVQVASWEVVAHSQVSPEVAETRRAKTAGEKRSWWWN